MADDDYVYDEASGEWMSASDIAARDAAASAGPEVRDAVGNLLADGDSVALIKDLTVKGAGQTLKVGTVIKSIRLTGDAQEIDCRHDGIKGAGAARGVRAQALTRQCCDGGFSALQFGRAASMPATTLSQ